MKSLRAVGLAVAALAFFAPVSAQAETPAGWYLGMNTNMSFQTKGDSDVSNVTNSIEYKDGWGISGYSGYAWGNGLRTEGELNYRHSSADDISGVNSGTAGGGIHNLSLMGNLLYDFDLDARITPYVGAGVGVSRVGADNLRTINGATLDDNRYKLAYQGIAGFSLDLEGNWAFTADYRYFATPNVKFDSNTGARGETENASHNIMMGVRYAFAEPSAPAPEPAPIATPMPVPAPAAVPVPRASAPVIAPVPQSYMVFFDFDKSYLTPEAKRIIATAAADFKKGKLVRLLVTGHTDTMGSQAYNVKLSARRAASVQAEFVKLGVPAAEIGTRAAGESGLLVPTNDQVREVQNRRAEIVFE